MNRCAPLTAVLAVTAGAAAQNLVYNPSFEIPGGTSGAQGWRAFNTARLRTVGDGLGPILTRTGNSSVELPSGADFVGFTTDVFNPDTLTWYNPPYVYHGGPCTVSGYYAIPADQPLTGANGGLKLEFQRTPPDFSIYQSFESLTINGHTNGQWVFFSMTINDNQIDPSFPPYPTSVHVLPMRFGSASATGTIFWDDIRFVQTPPCYANCDGSTTPPVLNVNDFGCFLNRFAAGDTYANCDGSTTSPVLNVNDFGCFLNRFAAGCS